jgi:hypothetical protein
MRTKAPNDLIAQVVRLRQSVAGHKLAIRQHKEKLRAAAAELDVLEAECRRIGLQLVFTPPSGAGAIHGHFDSNLPTKTTPDL